MAMGATPPVPLVVIAGATASGKSALGVYLAQQLGGEVVCCDSTQLYRHFDIGTGKPTQEERGGVPHHLLDLLEPWEIFTAGAYRERAVAVLEELRGRQCLPIVTAGTGLYLRALLEGLAAAPVRSEELRARLSEQASKRGAGYLHRLLGRLDAAAAGRIAPQDEPKLLRAIEVCLLAGKPITEVHRAARPGLPGFTAVKIGLMPPRAELYARIERRVEEMLRAGWPEEVRGLLARGVPASAKPFQFIGYGQLAAHLGGECSLAEATQGVQQATRQYAKRQVTWFRRERDIHWLEGFGHEGEIQKQAQEYLEGQLGGQKISRRRGSQGL